MMISVSVSLSSRIVESTEQRTIYSLRLDDPFTEYVQPGPQVDDLGSETPAPKPGRLHDARRKWLYISLEIVSLLFPSYLYTIVYTVITKQSCILQGQGTDLPFKLQSIHDYTHVAG